MKHWESKNSESSLLTTKRLTPLDFRGLSLWSSASPDEIPALQSISGSVHGGKFLPVLSNRTLRSSSCCTGPLLGSSAVCTDERISKQSRKQRSKEERWMQKDTTDRNPWRKDKLILRWKIIERDGSTLCMYGQKKFQGRKAQRCKEQMNEWQKLLSNEIDPRIEDYWAR